MKNPQWPPADVTKFLNQHAGQITHADRATILDVISHTIAYYHTPEDKRAKISAYYTWPTQRAKKEIYYNTGLTRELRADLAKLIDAAAIRAIKPRYTLPVCAKNYVQIKINQCFLI